jgi:hypothetical protein
MEKGLGEKSPGITKSAKQVGKRNSNFRILLINWVILLVGYYGHGMIKIESDRNV